MKDLNLAKSVQTTMSSLEIAKLTGKRHDNVIVDIRKMFKSLNLQAPDFSEACKLPSGQNTTIYNLPKRECDILVSGYEIRYRAAIIDRWQELEAGIKPLSEMEIVLKSAQALVDMEKEQAKQNDRMNAIENKQKLQDGNTGYLTIVAYCRLNNIPQPLKQARKHGKRATRLSKEWGYKIGKVPDERWGQVNSYSVDVLDEIFFI